MSQGHSKGSKVINIEDVSEEDELAPLEEPEVCLGPSEISKPSYDLMPPSQKASKLAQFNYKPPEKLSDETLLSVSTPLILPVQSSSFHIKLQFHF